MTSAGRILIMPKGDWNAETEYQMLDLVTHKGYAFLARRDVVGIEPSNDNAEYWFNLLDINKVVEDGIANIVADDVANVLAERYKEMLSEARYVSNLIDDFTEATFVRWDEKTENTPCKEGLTEYTEGFAIICGSLSGNHTVIAWTVGGDAFECFAHYINSGEDKGWKSWLSTLDEQSNKLSKEIEKLSKKINVVKDWTVIENVQMNTTYNIPEGVNDIFIRCGPVWKYIPIVVLPNEVADYTFNVNYAYISGSFSKTSICFKYARDEYNQDIQDASKLIAYR